MFTSNQKFTNVKFVRKFSMVDNFWNFIFKIFTTKQTGKTLWRNCETEFKSDKKYFQLIIIMYEEKINLNHIFREIDQNIPYSISNMSNVFHPHKISCFENQVIIDQWWKKFGVRYCCLLEFFFFQDFCGSINACLIFVHNAI